MNNYKIYKKKVSKEAYFRVWTPEQIKGLTEDLKTDIYNKYLMKCDVFNRDNFECQNLKCLKNGTPLTLHHIKWQKNNGENKPRNGVTLCNTCHQGYHKAKRELVFKSDKYLPAHIRGHVFKLDKPDKISWKRTLKENKQLRKTLKEYCGIKLTWQQVAMLMRWLEFVAEE